MLQKLFLPNEKQTADPVSADIFTTHSLIMTLLQHFYDIFSKPPQAWLNGGLSTQDLYKSDVKHFLLDSQNVRVWIQVVVWNIKLSTHALLFETLCFTGE